jgi:hypothetical protein
VQLFVIRQQARQADGCRTRARIADVQTATHLGEAADTRLRAQFDGSIIADPPASGF